MEYFNGVTCYAPYVHPDIALRLQQLIDTDVPLMHFLDVRAYENIANQGWLALNAINAVAAVFHTTRNASAAMIKALFKPAANAHGMKRLLPGSNTWCGAKRRTL